MPNNNYQVRLLTVTEEDLTEIITYIAVEKLLHLIPQSGTGVNSPSLGTK